MEKRILVYTNHYDPEYFKINDVVQWLFDNGANVSVITGNPNYPSGKLFKGFSAFGSKEIVKKGLIIYRLPLITRGKGTKPRLVLNYLSYFLSSIVFTLWCILFHKKYSTVFVHHTSPPLLFLPAILYKKIRKSKAILWDLDMWPQTLEAMNMVKKRSIINLLENIFKQLYKEFDKVLIGSKSFEKIAKKRIPAEQIEYFPNWADKVFENVRLDINPPKQDDKIIITYTGNIGVAQGFQVLIDVIKATEKNNFQFNFVGSGRYKSQLKKLVSANNLDSRIIFFDPVSSIDLIPFFEKTHYLYLSLKDTPLFSKTVPAKLQTYLATGKPIISVISGEAKDLLTQNNCGFHVEAGDKEKLMDVFYNLDQVSSLNYKNFSKNSMQLFKEVFSSKKRRKQLATILLKNDSFN